MLVSKDRSAIRCKKPLPKLRTEENGSVLSLKRRFSRLGIACCEAQRGGQMQAAGLRTEN
jgi:hypothetical protein